MTPEHELLIAKDVIKALAAVPLRKPTKRELKRDYNTIGSAAWNYVHALEMLKVWRECYEVKQ